MSTKRATSKSPAPKPKASSSSASASPAKPKSPKSPKSPAANHGNGKTPAHHGSELNPVSHHLEFGGVPGTLFLPLLLVGTVFLLQIGASDAYVLNLSTAAELPARLSAFTPRLPSSRAFAAVVGWFGFQAALERLLPGDEVEGTLLRDGTRLTYKVNGHLAFWVSLLYMGHGWVPTFDESWNFTGVSKFDLEWIYDNYLDLSVSAMIFSFLLSLYLYARSFRPGALLALGGNSGHATYDWFIGRELNPREGSSFDWKFFCELRPGLIGWVVINAGCAMKQYRTLGHVTPAMVLVNLFQGFYVWDALYSERAILTTMDIVTDGFGFMLAFGDLAWVPFTYSVQARYLVNHTPDMPAWYWVFCVALAATGMFIFRAANGEKDQFKRDPTHPDVAHIQYIVTKRGTKLMTTGGWWGMARKINYLGDWLLSLGMSAPTGFGCPLTYFYPGYFAVLLIHRAMRDDAACAEKYGEDWVKYKKAVPYLFIPGVF